MLAACSIPADKPPEIYWPMPPDKPRIKFLDYVMGSIDATGVRIGKFRHVLFGEESESLLNKPTFAKVKDGALYVSDLGKLHVFDFKNKRYIALGEGLFVNLTGIDIASDGTIYAGDTTRLSLFIIKHKDGKFVITEVRETDRFQSIGGIAVDEKNNRVYAADTKSHRFNVFDLEGRFIDTFGRRGADDGQFNYPYDMAVDKDGRLFVLDSGNFRVQIFEQSGRFWGKFGAAGSAPGTFARPKGLALDSEGHIYVSDAAFNNFQIFDDKGRTYLSVGKAGTEPGDFMLPFGIDLDEDDKVYVVDQVNKRVQVFQYIKYPGGIEARPEQPAPAQ